MKRKRLIMKMNHKKNLEDFRVHLKENDRKYTVEREGILRIVSSIEEPHTLPQLYDKARKRNLIHAKSTLYRNISLFVDAGFVREIQFPTGKTIYEPSCWSV